MKSPAYTPLHRSLGRTALLAACAAFAATTGTAARADAPQPAPIVPDAAELARPFDRGDATAFKAPPKVFFPETWMHFLGGNVAKPGITADLDAIAGAGFSGVQLFHGNQGGGNWPGVTESIACLSPKWDDAVRHTALEARRLGLRFTMQNCPGWAMSGGPWIKEPDAMRHLTQTRTDVPAGTTVNRALPSAGGRDYRDVAVIAFPTPLGDTNKPLALSFIKGSKGVDWAKLLTGGSSNIEARDAANPTVWVEFSLPEGQVARTIEFPPVNSLSHGFAYTPDVDITVEAVLANGSAREILKTPLPPGSWQDDRAVSLALSEPPAGTTAYRVTLANKHKIRLGSLRLYSAARKNNWEALAGWTLHGLIPAGEHPVQAPAAFIDPAKILDISSHRRGDNLTWQAPVLPNGGTWTILRIGHVNTGQRNGPAPREGTGWECDKLSFAGPDAHYAGYIGRLANGPLSGGLLSGMLMDSWECKTQTWTKNMEAEFKNFAGYELRTWLPAVFGYVVRDHDTTARFLRDWRGNIGDLFANKFFGRMAEHGRKNGLAISYETAAGDIFPADILEYYKHADVPMTEFWQPFSEGYVGDLNFKPIKPTASAARLYGKPRVAAEAFTSFSLTWNEHFEMLKELANIKSVEGVTHMVFHQYTHNPRVEGFKAPGAAFGTGIGTPFLRGQTWWRHMPEFNTYLARLSYLLERGKPVSDVLWYLGDEIPHKPDQNAPFPEGFKYDYCNPDVLLNRLSVDPATGNFVTPEGISYRVLWLPDTARMLPETVEKLLAHVRAGATIIGNPPQGPATLRGGSTTAARLEKAARALWGDTAQGIRRIGKGRVISGALSLESALWIADLAPDVIGVRAAPDSTVDDTAHWVHRRTAGADWYFVCAPRNKGFQGTLNFRATGAVELWDPVTGDHRAALQSRAGNRTTVALDIPKAGAVFVVFKDATAPAAATPARIAAAPAANNIQIVSAHYGDLANANRTVDLTKKVSAAFANGTRQIEATNDFAGGDPANQTVKQLAVVIRRPDGSTTKLVAAENQTLDLGATPSDAASADAELSRTGRAVIAWKPGAVTVVYSDGTVKKHNATAPAELVLAPWKLTFPAGWGAPETPVALTELKPWKDIAALSPEARAFSGTANYETTFELPNDYKWTPRARNNVKPLQLDLGSVEMIAEISINGKKLRTLWAPPYRTNLDPRLLKPGKNVLTVAVTSTWYNRLSYDNKRPESERKTWTLGGPRGASVPSGLLGPVTLRTGERIALQAPAGE